MSDINNEIEVAPLGTPDDSDEWFVFTEPSWNQNMSYRKAQNRKSTRRKNYEVISAWAKDTTIPIEFLNSYGQWTNIDTRDVIDATDLYELRIKDTQLNIEIKAILANPELTKRLKELLK